MKENETKETREVMERNPSKRNWLQSDQREKEKGREREKERERWLERHKKYSRLSWHSSLVLVGQNESRKREAGWVDGWEKPEEDGKESQFLSFSWSASCPSFSSSSFLPSHIHTICSITNLSLRYCRRKRKRERESPFSSAGKRFSFLLCSLISWSCIKEKHVKGGTLSLYCMAE